MSVVILAGGLGTRLSEETDTRPKPMVEIGGQPILWHIMKHYGAHGFREFFIAARLQGRVDQALLPRVHGAERRPHHRPRPGQGGVAGRAGRRLARAPDRHRRDDRHRRPGPAPRVAARRRDVHDDLRRRRVQRRPARAARLPSRARQDRDRHRRAAAGALRRHRLRRRPRGGLQREAADRRRLDQRRLLRLRARASSTISTATSRASRRDALERLAADRQLAAYRHDGFWQCMDTLRDRRLLEELWQSGEAPWKVVVTASVLARPADVRHRRHRARRRLARAAPRRRRRRRRLPGARLGAAVGARSRRPHRRGHASSAATCCDQPLLERVARRVRDRHRLPPRRADDRRRSRTATRSRRSRRTSRGTWALLEACRRSPTGQADRASRRPTRRTATTRSCRTPRTRRSQGRHPYDVSKSCADLIATAYATTYGAAGRDHPLRQLLRRRRPELEPHRARHDPLGAPRRAAGHPLRRRRSSATTSTSRTAAAAYMHARRAARRPSRRRAARRSTSRTSSRSPSLELVRRILELMESRRSSPTIRNEALERDSSASS